VRMSRMAVQKKVPTYEEQPGEQDVEEGSGQHVAPTGTVTRIVREYGEFKFVYYFLDGHTVFSEVLTVLSLKTVLSIFILCLVLLFFLFLVVFSVLFLSVPFFW